MQSLLMNIGGGKGGNFVRDLVKVYAFSRADRRKKKQGDDNIKPSTRDSL